jgi:putative intracellular protease/amidase
MVHSIRTNQWRIFDFLWMLHILDFESRDNINNWLLRLFSVLGLVTLLSGYWLFFVSRRRRPVSRVLPVMIAFILLGACQQPPPAKALPNSNESHDQMMKTMFAPAKLPIKSVGILLYDGFTTLDAMGPHQVMSELMGVKVFFVGRHAGPIRNMTGMQVLPDSTMEQVQHLDVLIVPGGLRETFASTRDTALLNWIKKIDQTSTMTASVCTGAWILGAAGVLQGKEATTHWYGKKILAEEYGARVLNKRWVVSGKYWTSAGVTAGMDMCLAMLQQIRGDDYTKAAMLDLEYDPAPPLRAGSEQNTDAFLVEGMRRMYDKGISEARQQPPQKQP